jgi:hypothetical protein
LCSLGQSAMPHICVTGLASTKSLCVPTSSEDECLSRMVQETRKLLVLAQTRNGIRWVVVVEKMQLAFGHDWDALELSPQIATYTRINIVKV